MHSVTIWYNGHHPEWYDAGVLENLHEVKRAGFTHINWNPDAGSSYMYSVPEMEHLKDLIKDSQLLVKSVHGAHGQHFVMEIKSEFRDKRKDITSLCEWRRKAGVELVQNRLLLAHILECDNIVLHIVLPPTHIFLDDSSTLFNSLFKSLEELESYAQKLGVRIAIENLQYSASETKILFDTIFERYSEKYIGWAYDTGHAHSTGFDFDFLNNYSDRLIATHLQDTWGAKDDHLLPGFGNINWDRVAQLIAESPYELPLNLEVEPSRYHGNNANFYERAYNSIKTITEKVVSFRKISSKKL